VDYTGYLDGEAFDGGSATDTVVEISDDNGYIDGFTDGLIGAEVGTTIDCPVTFPEDYGVDSLNGQDVIFTFTINGIYENVTIDTLSDDAVEENFGDKYDVHTAQELWDYVEDYLTDQAISNFIEDYMLENSEVTVPEDYLEACLNEYQESYATSYYGDLDTMEYYMELYGSSLDEWRESYRDYINSSIQLQLIFEVISIKENMEVDEEEFQDYLQSTYLDSSSYSFEDEQDLYESAGDGDSEKGKAYLQKMYLTNQAYNYVIENANVEEG
jgi:FKBP-type peptidyl-prolyl cis-trans isomerase (trigger factor)